MYRNEAFARQAIGSDTGVRVLLFLDNSLSTHFKHTCDKTCIKLNVVRGVLELSVKICISYTNVDIIYYCY